VRVFEVDAPATLQFKRAALAAAGISAGDGVRFVAADLAADPLAGCLAAAGFDLAAPAVVAWLGVTMYLTPESVAATLGAIAGLAPGTEVIADYFLPEDERDETGADYGRQVAASSAQHGEPWRSAFTPGQIADVARSAGLAGGRSVRQRDTIAAELWQRTDALRPTELAVLFHGTTRPR
jgi:methyltransferase (TIGR00027 family)